MVQNSKWNQVFQNQMQPRNECKKTLCSIGIIAGSISVSCIDLVETFLLILTPSTHTVPSLSGCHSDPKGFPNKVLSLKLECTNKRVSNVIQSRCRASSSAGSGDGYILNASVKIHFKSICLWHYFRKRLQTLQVCPPQRP